MQLCNRADGVDGHFCVGRFNHEGGFMEFWTEHCQNFTSAGTVYVGEKIAMAKLQELKSQIRLHPHFQNAAKLLETVELRDKFAMATIQGLWGSPDMQGLLLQMSSNEDLIKEELAMTLLAGIAYRQADAMLKYRNGAE